MPTLTVENLSISFLGNQALKNASLCYQEGEFLGLMGPNGAGKTTLINCISRLYAPDKGSIKFGEINLLNLKCHEILDLGISRTFQDLNFFSKIERMTIMDYLRVGQFSGSFPKILSSAFQNKNTKQEETKTKRRAREILDFFRQMRLEMEPPEEERGYPKVFGREGAPDLQDLERSPIASLSFAWRRRLDLARALISEPKLLLLDEPAQGLAPSEIENLGRSLKIIQREFSVGAIIVEHNVDTLMSISDRIVVMNAGSVIAEGEPSEVASNQEVIEVYLGKKDDLDEPKVLPERELNSTDHSPLLEIRNLDLFYGSAQALFGVSLKIQKGIVTSILGTNGSGKSTLLKAIVGAEKPRHGEIFLNGLEVPLGWPESACDRGIQYVPQGHRIFPELTVLQNLEIGGFALLKKGGNYELAVQRVLNYFPDLRDRLKVHGGSLSGGQQQMLAIAQALVSEPEILLLDEPSLGLSPILVDTVFDIIYQVSKKEQTTVLIVEQNVNKALKISDYIFMMSTGAIIADGPSEIIAKNDTMVKNYLGFR